VADVAHTPALEAFAIVTRRDGDDADEETLAFARELALGALEGVEALDLTIQEQAANWSMVRMAAVDRNVLRLAAYELESRPDTPVGVIIDEAIEIVRKYSTEEATRFINGILDSLKKLRDGKPKKKNVRKKEPEG
jgi:N utilization substance protein B